MVSTRKQETAEYPRDTIGSGHGRSCSQSFLPHSQLVETDTYAFRQMCSSDFVGRRHPLHPGLRAFFLREAQLLKRSDEMIHDKEENSSACMNATDDLRHFLAVCLRRTPPCNSYASFEAAASSTKSTALG